MSTPVLTRLIRVVALLAGGVGLSMAGSFGVTPMMVTLSAGQRSTAITIHNSDQTPAVIQTQLLAWSQRDGKDVTVPTQELLATPPIFTVPPGADRTVRIGLRRPLRSSQEQSYRVLVTEIPPPAEPGFKGMRMALRMSLPIFITPANAPPPILTWRLSRSTDKHLLITATNSGGTHVKFKRVSVFTASGDTVGILEGGRYVLAGQGMQWQTKILSPKVDTPLVIVAEPVNGNEIKSEPLPVGEIP